ncbi:hypothetical protein, partial [Rhodoferax sp.]|uniref:hypothetical protein n=1 Tax=Rhodoferax sp. TaxID=50421 RepID=UPI00274CE8E3|nr:hypothetical protein [Rhodoferax sp.]
DQQRILWLARRSLIVLAAMVLVGVALYGGTDWLKDRSRAQLAQVQQQVDAGRASLTLLQGDLANLQADVGRFASLRQQGMVGRPDRAAWAEQLVASRARAGLPDSLSYTLQAPAPLALQAAMPGADGAPVQATPQSGSDDPGRAEFHDLDIVLTDIHEQELLAFLSDYRAQVKGRFRVNACALTARTETGLSARCTLRFFTLDDGAPAAKAQ